MKLLLDQGIGRGVISCLGAAGVFAEHVADLGLAQASDPDILEAARKRQAVVVTLDADFHQLLAISQADGPSVIRIRIESLKSAEVARLLIDVLKKFENELSNGAAISVTMTNIRAKTLPIGI